MNDETNNINVAQFLSVRYAIARNAEVRDIAHWCADNESTGRAGDPLPAFMSSRARNWIWGNRRAFVQMVRDARTHTKGDEQHVNQ